MGVLGIGVDIVRTARFAEIIARTPHRLARLQQRILHPLEIKPNQDRSAAVRQLASAWAAKEALYKSLDFKAQQHCRFNEWRMHRGESRYIMKSNQSNLPYEVLISISHDGEYTIAQALRQPVAKQVIN